MADSADSKKEVRAKLFANGRSQAVRLPKEFRFEGKEVRVRRTASGGILLEPIEGEKLRPWSTLEDLYAHFSQEDADPIFPEEREQPAMQERDWSAFE
jgi:antitoxin VapB